MAQGIVLDLEDYFRQPGVVRCYGSSHEGCGQEPGTISVLDLSRLLGSRAYQKAPGRVATGGLSYGWRLNTELLILDGLTTTNFILSYLKINGIIISEANVKSFVGGCYIAIPSKQMAIRIMGSLVSLDTDSSDVSDFKPTVSMDFYHPASVTSVMALIKAKSRTIQ